jgi:hypothetical protein
VNSKGREGLLYKTRACAARKLAHGLYDSIGVRAFSFASFFPALYSGPPDPASLLLYVALFGASRLAVGLQRQRRHRV